MTRLAHMHTCTRFSSQLFLHALPYFAWVLLTTAVTVAVGCGGPSVQFDPKPAPPWLNEKASTIENSGELGTVGSAPATLDIQRDADLATRDAKSRIAQMFQSQVVSRSSDWSLASAGGKNHDERTVSAQSVEVRTNVKVEDATVSATYRDEATRTHYVKVIVDRAAWSQRLNQRLAASLNEMESHVRDGGAALSSRRALTALALVLEGYAKGKEIEPDVVVSDLLASHLGYRSKLGDIKKNLDEVNHNLHSDFTFVIDNKSPGKVANTADNKAIVDAQQRLATDLTQFLGSYGFAVSKSAKAGTLRIAVSINERFVRTEDIADRKESVHTALGTLKVFDADGSEVTRLSVDLGDERYNERDVNDGTARQKALTLAADTLAANFRSAFRKVYPLEQ